jgi:hypothetical protein
VLLEQRQRPVIEEIRRRDRGLAIVQLAGRAVEGFGGIQT